MMRRRCPLPRLDQTRRTVTLMWNPLSFVTVEEKDTGLSSKQSIESEDDERTNKKQKPDNANCFDMDLMIKELTAVVRELEEHEFRSIVDVLGEDRSAEIECVIGSMICLVKTSWKLNNILSENLVLYKKLKKKREKQIRKEAYMIAWYTPAFIKSTLWDMAKRNYKV